MAEALSGLHDRARTVHLDLKPENILLTPSGEVRLTDFGISTRLPGRLSRLTVTRVGFPPEALFVMMLVKFSYSSPLGK
jgi:serine/threonine protein kinase